MGFRDFSPWTDSFPSPELAATYAQGVATIELTRDGEGQTINLDRVGRGSHLVTDLGASASWRNGQGWVLQVSAFDWSGLDEGAPGPFGEQYSADVALQLIGQNEVWRADSYGDSGNRCIVDLETVSETSLAGTATCRGLRWVDGTAMTPFGPPAYIEAEAAFDAEISFEARP